MAHHFRDAGYTTGYIGKWHLGSSEPVQRDEQGGYEFWLGANLLEFVSDAYPAPDGYAEALLDPWTPPDLRALSGTAPSRLPGYYGMVRRLDETLGRLLDALRSLNLMDDTVVLFVSDHGNHFKTRNGEYKRSCHESNIRVPCAAIGPQFAGGGRVENLVSLVDMPPTLLDVAGIQIPGDMEGRSALELVRQGPDQTSPDPGWPDHVFIQVSEAETGRAVRTGRWKYGVTAPEKSGPEHSYSDVYAETHLYDLKHDPYELENLITSHAHSEVRLRMRKLLLKRIESVEKRSPSIVEAATEEIGQRKVQPDEVLE